jgi:hypothetical protein
MKEVIESGEITVKLDAFSYGWGSRSERAVIAASGRVLRQGIDCTFRLEVKRKGHRLDFPKATTKEENEDIRSLAISVKNALLRFLQESPEVPDAHRETLCACVLNHHKQNR